MGVTTAGEATAAGMTGAPITGTPITGDPTPGAGTTGGEKAGTTDDTIASAMTITATIGAITTCPGTAGITTAGHIGTGGTRVGIESRQPPPSDINIS
jgi:hypothetical protein